VPAADGTTEFSVLQNELKGRSTSIVLVTFDLLYLNGRDIRKEPLVRSLRPLFAPPVPLKVRMRGSNYTEILQAEASLGHRLQCNLPGRR
jgi:ATP-dependent DNA ligase